MASRQFLTSDTSTWLQRYGSGSDGAYTPSTGTDAPIDSACIGTINTTSLTATNVSFAAGQLILIHQTQGTGVGQWELKKIDSYTAGTITTSYSLIYGYATGAQVVVLKQYSSALIDTGVTLTGKAWNGTVGGITGWFCKGTTTITGSIVATGKGFRGAAQSAQGVTQGLTGEGTVGVSVSQTAANGNGGGGGYGTSGSVGAGGGGGNAANGTAGDAGGGTAGAAGSSAGAAALTTMVIGGGGGAGAAKNEAGRYGGAGGAGGGNVLIISKNITITGSIISGAVGGSTGNSDGAGGGGGAGGSCLLKGQVLTLGTNLITTPAGAASSGSETTHGGAGSVGRIHADYSSSITGTTTPTIDTTQDIILNDTSGFFAFF